MSLWNNEVGVEIVSYPSGVRALAFKGDGSGYIYYPSGCVAVYKTFIDGKSYFYMYADGPRSTPLGAINEHAVGFCLDEGGARLALNKVRFPTML